MRPSPISLTIDLNAKGKQHGFMRLPYSHDGSAWGCIMIPITCISNGNKNGSTALLTAGNHGDEYEGITVLHKLINELEEDDVDGRIIIVPSMNHPAVMNESRTSPIDKGNMNRLFPGNPNGTVTEQIADYFNRYLIPICDCALDLHSGGKTLDIIPFAAAHRQDDKQLEAKAIEAAKAFGAPNTLILFEMDAERLYDTAIERQGKIFVGTELGGGGTTTPEGIEISERGVKNFLKFFNIIEGDIQSQDTQFLDMPDASHYVVTEQAGLLEYCIALGDWVTKGDPIVHIYNIERTGEKPITYISPHTGVFVARRHPCMANIGDTIAVIAIEEEI